MTNQLSQDTLSIDMGEDSSCKMSQSIALIEWESSGLGDVPTDNLFEMQGELCKEMMKREAI